MNADSIFQDMDPELKSALGMAMGYLSLRERSTREMNDYLLKKGFTDQMTEKAIEQLKENNYLNDRRFAEMYLENRKKNKPKSIFALSYELDHKGIEPSIIDELLSDFDNLELAFLAVKQKIKSWKHLERESRKKKMMNYLRYRGFSFSVCQATWQRVFSSISKPE